MTAHDAQDTPLSCGTYRTLAVLAATLGTACAVVNAWFFTLGLQRMDFDATARAPLLAAGILMVLTEHAAFGLAALLPRVRFAALRRLLLSLGALLLAFEVSSMYTAQAALAQASASAQEAHATRIEMLRTAVDSRRTAIDTLRTSGERQSASTNAWTRHLGAKAIQTALAGEAELAPLAAELAHLQASTAPTQARALGERGLLATNVARAVLIGGMGLLMFSASGALWATYAATADSHAETPRRRDASAERSAQVATEHGTTPPDKRTANRRNRARDAPRITPARPTQHKHLRTA